MAVQKRRQSSARRDSRRAQWMASVKKPVNVVMGFLDPSFTLEQLGAAGVKRVSIGGGLQRVAMAAFMDAAREMRAGRFGFVARMAKQPDLLAAFRGD